MNNFNNRLFYDTAAYLFGFSCYCKIDLEGLIIAMHSISPVYKQGESWLHFFEKNYLACANTKQ